MDGKRRVDVARESLKTSGEGKDQCEAFYLPNFSGTSKASTEKATASSRAPRFYGGGTKRRIKKIKTR